MVMSPANTNHFNHTCVSRNRFSAMRAYERLRLRNISRHSHCINKNSNGKQLVFYSRVSFVAVVHSNYICRTSANTSIGDVFAAKKYIQFISWHVVVDGWASVDICMHQFLFECKSALRDANRTCTDWPTIFFPLIASIIYVSVAQWNSEWFFPSSIGWSAGQRKTFIRCRQFGQ